MSCVLGGRGRDFKGPGEPGGAGYPASKGPKREQGHVVQGPLRSVRMMHGPSFAGAAAAQLESLAGFCDDVLRASAP